jgi:hypothetical protein
MLQARTGMSKKDLAENGTSHTGEYFMNGRNIHYVDFNHTLVGGTLKVT